MYLISLAGISRSHGWIWGGNGHAKWTATDRNATSTATLLLEWVERLAKDMKDGRSVLKKSVPLEEPLAVGNTNRRLAEAHVSNGPTECVNNPVKRL